VSDAVTLAVVVVGFSYVASTGGAAWLAILCASVALLVGYVVRFGLHLVANRQLVRRVRSESTS
jgi:hypothetical protein